MWKFEVQDIGTNNIFTLIGKNFKDACVRNGIKMTQVKVLSEMEID